MARGAAPTDAAAAAAATTRAKRTLRRSAAGGAIAVQQETEEKAPSPARASKNDTRGGNSNRNSSSKRRALRDPEEDDDDDDDNDVEVNDDTAMEDVKLEAPGSAAGIPASIRVRIASPPVAARHEADEFEDDDVAAALRIDANSNCSPTSVTSAPTSPADDSGLNTPNTPNGSEALGGAHKRRRLEDPPMFLEKTYEMLEKCAPEIACWAAPAGESFIVKKPIEFAEHVIPVYFKHKNFSSFVRQLNFYGFRKVRVDAETAASVDPKEWWEFRHDKFVRGRRDLLREIKRRTIADGRSTIERAEMDELRAELFGLKDQVQQLNKHMMRVMDALMVSSSNTSNNSGGSASNASSPSRPPVASYDYRQHQHPQPQHHHQPQSHHSQQAYYAHHQPRPSTPGSGASSSSSSSHPPLPSLQQQQHHHHALLQLHQGVPQSGKTPAGMAPSSRSAVISGRMSNGGGGAPTPASQPQLFLEGSKRNPATTYQLRPLQSVVPTAPHHLPPGATTTSTAAAAHHASPVFSYRNGPGSAPAGMSFVDRVDWSSYGRHPAQPPSYESQPRFASSMASGPERSGMPPSSLLSSSAGSSHRRVEAARTAPSHPTGFKRVADESSAMNCSTSHLNETPPDAAVRQLSMTAMQTRSELLGCIISRILGFIRIQQQQQPPPRMEEVDAVADVVVSDIQQLLARVQEPPRSPAGSQTANSEAACMYRVEILKFISRELPRAVQDSVEKRIPQHAKKGLNRSLLAMLVQKAQAALEHQMRVETTASPHNGAPGAAAPVSVLQQLQHR
ncbi:hypothetical protein PybrP1_009003 [[Pythium] brassicae (nom. inval.)]|nr:hypothetical protein PybrP1_009003 [[Pythium] brassicae (nom. inval.)]